jgi:hypothetical protein
MWCESSLRDIMMEFHWPNWRLNLRTCPSSAAIRFFLTLENVVVIFPSFFRIVLVQHASTTCCIRIVLLDSKNLVCH